MSARRGAPPPYGSRSAQAPGMMRHGSYPAGHSTEPLPHPERADSKLLAQSAEIETLAADNQRLAATHVALREDLVTTQQEIQKVRAHIGSIQTESDIQIRILLDKIAKMEVHMRAGENVKKDLQRAHTEARTLVATRQELISQIEQATQEFEKTHADVDKMPEMRDQLDGLRQEHQKLRSTFEYDKGLNMEKVAQMEHMEKELVGMAREMEKFRAEVLNAEKRAHAPSMYGGPYMNPEPYPPPPPARMHVGGGGGYGGDGYANHHHVQMGGGAAGGGTIPYGGGHPGPAAPGGNPQWGAPPMNPYGGGHPGPAAPGGNPQWGGPPYDHSHPRA